MTCGRGGRALRRAAAARRSCSSLAAAAVAAAGGRRPDRLPRAARALGRRGRARARPALAPRSSSRSTRRCSRAGVVAAALVVGVPLAWLVVRTDLPGRRVLGPRRLAAARDPELRRRARAARSARAARPPPGAARAARRRDGCRTSPATGARSRAHALDLPVRLPPRRGGAAERRPDGGGGSAQPRRAARAAVFWRVTLPALRPSLAARRSSSRSTCSPTSARLAHGLLDAHDRHLRALRVAARARRRGDPRARPGRARRRGRARLPSRWRLRGAIYRSTPGAGRPPSSSRSGVGVAGARLLHRSSSAFCLVLPLGVLVWWSVERRPDQRTRRDRLGGRAQLGRSPPAAQRSSRPLVVLPVAVLAWRYPSRARRAASSASPCPERAARDRGRARARLLRRPRIGAPLPEPRTAPVRAT